MQPVLILTKATSTIAAGIAGGEVRIAAAAVLSPHQGAEFRVDFDHLVLALDFHCDTLLPDVSCRRAEVMEFMSLFILV